MVEYELGDGVATITMDDGRANALSPDMQEAIGAALDRAAADAAAVVLAGREGRFSAGFDLSVMSAGGQAVVDMVIGGFDLSLRLLEWPRPVVVACTGHAMAMGAFLLLSADERIGADGPFKIAANEVAIGMTMPHTAVALMRMRLTPPAFQRSAILAETFDLAGAVTAGYLDRLVAPDAVVATARERAVALLALDAQAHRDTKARVRAIGLDEMSAAKDVDRAELSSLFG
ncbi:MAG: crotonase/enoyl-CoA hydratase family protein [Ilumatobacteraceae bacterium]